MRKDTFYFSHDYNSRSDSKIKRLIAKHGLEGYGVYWAIIEDLYNDANALPTDYESIAFDIRSRSDLVESVVKDFNLFVFHEGKFGSLSVQRRLDERASKSEKARLSALYRWNDKKDDANALPPKTDRNAIKDSIGEDNIEKKDTKPKYSFDDFYNAYGKKVNRKKTKEIWDRLKDEDKTLAVEQMNNHKAGKEHKFWKDPERYLKDRRWEDEPTTGTTKPTPAPQIKNLKPKKCVRVFEIEKHVEYDDGSTEWVGSRIEEWKNNGRNDSIFDVV